MKKKLVILGILITLMIFILVGIISIESHKSERIYVKDLPFYTKRATIIRDDIEAIKNETCKNSLKEMFDRINETHFTEDVSIKKYYNAYYKDNKTFLNFYEVAVNSCELKDNLDEIYVLVLAASNYPNEVKKRFLLSHEFVIKDYDSRKTLYQSADETGTYTTKILELQIINELISRVNK